MKLIGLIKINRRRIIVLSNRESHTTLKKWLSEPGTDIVIMRQSKGLTGAPFIALHFP